MTCEVVLHGELLVTLIALERTLTSVHQHVGLKMLAVGELLVAHLTLVLLDQQVNVVDVILQTTLAHEPLSASRALMWQ